MIARRRPVPRAQGLRLELVDALLDHFPPARRDDPNYDPFERFAHSLEQLARWRVEFREALLKEATARGLAAGHLDRVAKEKSDTWRLSLRPQERVH